MIHSLEELKDDKNNNEDNKKTTNSYTGGKSSGLAIENPQDEWMKNALKNENKEQYEKQKNHIKLTVYKNGFIIDDGDFRDGSIFENKKFMKQIEKGYIPQELVEKGYKDLGIELESYKDKIYEPPKEFHAFKGKGETFGNINIQDLKIDENLSTVIDKTKPICKINIRLFNGQVVNEEFNLSNTLNDIIKFVQKKSGSKSFELLEGFPPKPLTEFDKTIEELNIKDSLLTQRIN